MNAHRDPLSAAPRSAEMLRAGLATVAALLLGASALPVAAQGTPTDGPPRTALKVCQDPNNLPFSNVAGEGIENRLAELFGKSLGLPVTYYSFPARMGFVRNTLRFKLPGDDYPCDIVMGVPVGFDQVSGTTAYYRSTYALVYPQGKGLDGVTTVEDFLALDPARLKKLRIGLYDRSPASEWLSKHGLVDQGVPYQMLNADPAQYPGELLEKELAAGKVDVAIVWGPIAGFFAKRVQQPRMTVVPMKSEPGVRFDFAMAMGVRYGEREWKQRVEQWLESDRANIQAVLKEFGVPLLDEAVASGK